MWIEATLFRLTNKNTQGALHMRGVLYFCPVSGPYFERPDLEPGDFYYSSEGYIVFTEKYHLKRGYCCKSGCKHCPYGYNKKTGKVEGRKDPKS
jgi:hypothetical protein